MDVASSPTSPSTGLRCLLVYISARDNDTCRGAKVWSIKGHEEGGGPKIPFLVATGRAGVAVALPKAGCVRQEPGAGVAGCRMRRVCVVVCVCVFLCPPASLPTYCMYTV